MAIKTQVELHEDLNYVLEVKNENKIKYNFQKVLNPIFCKKNIKYDNF